MPKLLLTIICSLLLGFNSPAQYYLRGEVKDDQNRPVPQAKIYLFSKGTVPFSSGSSGAFGIPTTLGVDTITIQKDGFETLKIAVQSSKYQQLVLKMQAKLASDNKHRLASITKDLLKSDRKLIFASEESYNQIVENQFIKTEKYPETGFSLNVDRASYSNIRRFLNMKSMVPPDAVRIEEILNYFSLNANPADSSTEFVFTSKLTNVPWQDDKQLLFINLQAPKLDLSTVKPSNFVFLIDVSGSMDKPNRLPLVQSGLKLLTRNLRDIDTVSIVVYGGDIGVLLPPTCGYEKEKIIQSIEKLVPGGSTPGEAALRTAYRLAKSTFISGGNNRIILATDGDFNVGQVSEKELEDLIVAERQNGVYLTCLGVGMGNYKDSKLETLAKKGNGNFAYLDNLKEAEKVLVTEFTKTLYAVANDAYLSVQFNPDLVQEYRLVGFNNKEEALSDVSSELEGGEIGTGHTVTAIFEIIPTEKNKVATLDKKLAAAQLAAVKLQYKKPNTESNVYQMFDVPFVYENIYAIDKSYRLSTALIMFGSLLRYSLYAIDKYSWDTILNLANTAIVPDDVLQKEFITLVEKAKKIYGNIKVK